MRFMAAFALALVIGVGAAKAEIYRSVTEFDISATSTEATSGKVFGTGYTMFRFVLDGATGHVAFLRATADNISDADVEKTFLPNGTPIEVRTQKGPVISVQTGGGGGDLHVTVISP